jgi:hypothetical protein
MTSRGKNWVFTLNNYNEDDVERLSNDNDLIEYIVFGKEVGESGTPHLQGFVQFKSRVRFSKAQSFIGRRAHIEIAKHIAAAIKYCKKDGDFIEIGTQSAGAGKRSDLDEFKESVKGGVHSAKELREMHSEVFAKYRSFCLQYIQDNLPEKEIEDFDLREWQASLKEKLDGEADNRSIIFVVDKTGNSGKTWFAHWYTKKTKGCQVLQPGKYADMAYALDPTIRTLFVDAPRSKQGEFLQYDFFEHVKNGYVFSPKYESMVKHLSKLHVVVMMNEDPDLTKLSMDRFVIYELAEKFGASFSIKKYN